LPLEVIECPDRRIDRAAAELVALELIDLDTEVSILLPRREYTRSWHRLLHDRSSDSISRALSTLPHCNVTIVPYHLGDAKGEGARLVHTQVNGDHPKPKNGASARFRAELAADLSIVDGQSPIEVAQHRRRVTIAGRVHAVRVQPRAGVATLECTIIDGTGSMTVVFLGRRDYPGLHTGRRVVVEGIVGEHHGRLAMLNPRLELLAEAHVEKPPSGH
jgi:hypothetical protein